jgi:hypothetical protein
VGPSKLNPLHLYGNNLQVGKNDKLVCSSKQRVVLKMVYDGKDDESNVNKKWETRT